jgi:hypothetical protein
MDRKVDSLALMAPELGIVESKLDDLRQTLQKVDEMIEEFYEIHAGLIRDEGSNP